MNHMVIQHEEDLDREDYDPDAEFERQCDDADEWYDRRRDDLKEKGGE